MSKQKVEEAIKKVNSSNLSIEERTKKNAQIRERAISLGLSSNLNVDVKSEISDFEPVKSWFRRWLPLRLIYSSQLGFSGGAEFNLPIEWKIGGSFFWIDSFTAYFSARHPLINGEDLLNYEIPASLSLLLKRKVHHVVKDQIMIKNKAKFNIATNNETYNFGFLYRHSDCPKSILSASSADFNQPVTQFLGVHFKASCCNMKQSLQAGFISNKSFYHPLMKHKCNITYTFGNILRLEGMIGNTLSSQAVPFSERFFGLKKSLGSSMREAFCPYTSISPQGSDNFVVLSEELGYDFSKSRVFAFLQQGYSIVSKMGNQMDKISSVYFISSGVGMSVEYRNQLLELRYNQVFSKSLNLPTQEYSFTINAK